MPGERNPYGSRSSNCRLAVRLEHAVDSLRSVRIVERQSALAFRPVRLGRYAARARRCRLSGAAEREITRLEVTHRTEGGESVRHLWRLGNAALRAADEGHLPTGRSGDIVRTDGQRVVGALTSGLAVLWLPAAIIVLLLVLSERVRGAEG